jgi:hypothetical protein
MGTDVSAAQQHLDASERRPAWRAFALRINIGIELQLQGKGWGHRLMDHQFVPGPP